MEASVFEFHFRFLYLGSFRHRRLILHRPTTFR